MYMVTVVLLVAEVLLRPNVGVKRHCMAWHHHICLMNANKRLSSVADYGQVICSQVPWTKILLGETGHMLLPGPH